MHISKKVCGETEISIPSVFKSDLNLSFIVELSDELKSESANDMTDISTPTSKSDDKNSDGMFGIKRDLDLLFAGALFKKFVESMTPLVKLRRSAESFVSWRDPKKTLLYSIAATIGYLYYRGLGVIIFTAFFFYGNHILS